MTLKPSCLSEPPQVVLTHRRSGRLLNSTKPGGPQVGTKYLSFLKATKAS